jgi:hypothetical protein
MTYEGIQTIIEIATGADFNLSQQTTYEVNLYLSTNWKLLAIHQRGWNHETRFRYNNVDRKWEGYTPIPVHADMPKIPF